MIEVSPRSVLIYPPLWIWKSAITGISAATAPFLPITSAVATGANLLVITMNGQAGKAKNVQDAHGCD